jgi:hypothetical protein
MYVYVYDIFNMHIDTYYIQHTATRAGAAAGDRQIYTHTTYALRMHLYSNSKGGEAQYQYVRLLLRFLKREILRQADKGSTPPRPMPGYNGGHVNWRTFKAEPSSGSSVSSSRLYNAHGITYKDFVKRCGGGSALRAALLWVHC